MKNKKITLVLNIFLALFVGLVLIILLKYRFSSLSINSVVSIPSDAPLPTPTTVSQISPDGTYTITINTLNGESIIYVNEKVIMTKIFGMLGEISIPFNTWSPDNKYFFLNAVGEKGNEYLVMRATGMPVSSDTEFYMISDLFSQNYPDFVITSVTGWASPTLLIVNASSQKEPKMSFWFDVQSHKFIRLSNYFY